MERLSEVRARDKKGGTQRLFRSCTRAESDGDDEKFEHKHWDKICILLNIFLASSYRFYL